MTGGFDRFVAIDWSGARGRYDGVAVASCTPGRSAPVLVAAEGGRWTRSDVAEWIAAAALAVGDRLLIGIDCAFSLPFPAAARYVPGGGGAIELWAVVDRVAGSAADLHGVDFARHPDYAPDFWLAGPRRTGWVEPHRATDRACRADGLGAPDSPFKQFGPKTVGPGALAGMRLLHRLRRQLGGAAAIWPFDATATAPLVVVEIYPRLFWRLAGRRRSAKVRSAPDLDTALAALGSGPTPEGIGPWTDHQTDAVVSAAGLRALAGDPTVWSPPGLDPATARTEGWIFGVRGN